MFFFFFKGWVIYRTHGCLIIFWFMYTLFFNTLTISLSVSPWFVLSIYRMFFLTCRWLLFQYCLANIPSSFFVDGCIISNIFQFSHNISLHWCLFFILFISQQPWESAAFSLKLSLQLWTSLYCACYIISFHSK